MPLRAIDYIIDIIDDDDDDDDDDHAADINIDFV